MKTNKKYLFLSFLTILMVVGVSVGSLGFAQTTTLACTAASSSVNVNQAMVLTATGGSGTYFWSGTNLVITNPTGNQLTVSYPNSGTYAVTVTSGGQSATCNVVVTGAPAAGAPVCSPATQTVVLGQNAIFSATGGNGTYVWSSPDLTIANPSGSGFSANFASTGLKTMTVTSGGVAATCSVNVISSGTPIPPVIPGLPDTGFSE